MLCANRPRSALSHPLGSLGRCFTSRLPIASVRWRTRSPRCWRLPLPDPMAGRVGRDPDRRDVAVAAARAGSIARRERSGRERTGSRRTSRSGSRARSARRSSPRTGPTIASIRGGSSSWSGPCSTCCTPAAATSDSVRSPRFPPAATWFGRARRLADLFDRYSVRRPELIRHWNENRDVDAAGFPLEPHDRWQPHLWRLTRARIGEPSPPERFPALLDGLRAGTLAAGAPAAARGVRHHHAPRRRAVPRAGRGARRAPRAPSLPARPVPRRGCDGPRLRPRRARSDRSCSGPTTSPPTRSAIRCCARGAGPYRERTVLLTAAEARGLARAAPDRRRRITDAAPAPTLLARVQARPARRHRSRPATSSSRPTTDSIQVHSCHGPGPPGRGAARRDPAPARRRPDAARGRHRRAQPGDRGVRAVGGVRASGRRPTPAPGAEPLGRPRLAYRIADRSLRESYPAARRARHAARARRRPLHRVGGARVPRARARPHPVRSRRRRDRGHRPLDHRDQRALGARRRAPRALGRPRRATPPTRGGPRSTGSSWASRSARTTGRSPPARSRRSGSRAATSPSPGASPTCSRTSRRSPTTWSAPGPRRSGARRCST